MPKGKEWNSDEREKIKNERLSTTRQCLIFFPKENAVSRLSGGCTDKKSKNLDSEDFTEENTFGCKVRWPCCRNLAEQWRRRMSITAVASKPTLNQNVSGSSSAERRVRHAGGEWWYLWKTGHRDETDCLTRQAEFPIMRLFEENYVIFGISCKKPSNFILKKAQSF